MQQEEMQSKEERRWSKIGLVRTLFTSVPVPVTKGRTSKNQPLETGHPGHLEWNNHRLSGGASG